MILKNISLIKKKIINLNYSSYSIGYITSILASTSIPHSYINKNYFKRDNGYMSLKIIADPEYGLPYGLIPRIIMIWLCTEAKLTNSPKLYLGKNQNEFLKKLGFKSTGGINGTINRTRRQVIKLFHSNITLIYNKKNIHKFSNLNILDDGVFYWKKKNNFWNSNILLSKKFFNRIKKNSLPIDFNLIKLMRSPLAIDIYIWLIWRTKIIKKNSSVLISWIKLKLQFGSNYSNNNKGLSNFKFEFIKRLKYVCFFYRNLNVEILKLGLKIKYSYPHVSYLKNY